MLKFNWFNQLNWWVEIIQWIFKITESTTTKKGFSSSKLNSLFNIIQSWAVYECLKTIKALPLKSFLDQIIYVYWRFIASLKQEFNKNEVPFIDRK